MDIKREDGVRKAIKYCIENFDSKTAANRIVEFWKDELELQTKQCNIDNASKCLKCNYCDKIATNKSDRTGDITCEEHINVC